jgi:hypothetical protein
LNHGRRGTEASWPHEQAGRWRPSWRRRPSGGVGPPWLRAGVGIQRGKGGGARSCGRGASRWPSHVRRRPSYQHHRRRGAPAIPAAGDGRGQVCWLRRSETKVVTRLARAEEVRGSEERSCHGARPSRQWRHWSCACSSMADRGRGQEWERGQGVHARVRASSAPLFLARGREGHAAAMATALYA